MDTPTTVKPAPVEVVTPIKPSEAIRLGCLIAPVQAFGDSGNGHTACVHYAMLLGGAHGLGWMRANEVPCPACDRSYASLLHLNDDHRWSRERIADWLAGLGL